MLKETPNIWVYENPKTITIWWDYIPFEMTASIQWRNTIFHVRVSAHKIVNGSTRILSFLYNNKTYHCKLTKWKYMGGGHGDNYPEIVTQSHKIRISSGLNFLSLADELINPDSEDLKTDEHPLNFISPAADIDFDFPHLS
jgi:hypothetical protein